MKRWYSTQEVAAELGVSAETVRKFIHERRLAARVILGGKRPMFRVSADALADFRRRWVRDSVRDDWE